ncbi:MAG: hypothetical protein WCI73_03535 [Phycisphaerae bacterium]
MNASYRLRLFLAVMILLLAPSGARGQWQVNYQINTQISPNPPAYQGSTLYGHQNPIQNPLLPSQQRYEIMQSGWLPSELRMGATAAGPLAPGGVTGYLPAGSPLTRASAGPVSTPAPQGALAVPPEALPRAAGTVGPDWRVGAPIIVMPPGQQPLTGPPPMVRHPVETQPAATRASTTQPDYGK